MAKEPSKKETAYEFRRALATDFPEADALLQKFPGLIDRPVYGDSETALHFFATENGSKIVEWLLKKGASPDGVAENETPLHAAAQLGHRNVCVALIQAGADLERKDNVGETPLHKASQGGYVEIITDLLEAGANPTITDMCGERPVDQALPRKKEAVRKVFDRYRRW